MVVSVRYHANLSNIIGFRQEEVTLASGATVDDLKAHIKANHPSIEPLIRTALVSINATHAKEGDELQDGDQILIFPPISGGE
jgi:MoaD family protein